MQDTSLTMPQLRAARGLLGWSQKQLAAAAKVTPVALSRMERGETEPHASTLLRLRQVMEREGVEFLGAQGVRLRDEILEVEMLDGPDFMRNWQNRVVSAFAGMSGKIEALYVSTDERKFLQASPPGFHDQYSKLIKLGGRERILIPEGHRFFICLPEYTTYRWLPEELSGHVPHGICGDTVSFLFWQKPQRIMMIRNQALAQTFRKHFEALWRIARPLPFSHHEIRQIVKENWAKHGGAPREKIYPLRPLNPCATR